MTPGHRGWIVLAALAGALLFSLGGYLEAEGHTHEGTTGQFYATWMMPDAPWVSCCSQEDCAPAASRLVDGHWEARWRDEDEWIVIPAAKVEQNRDTPDGRSHMCGRKSGGSVYVFCFVRGGGV